MKIYYDTFEAHQLFSIWLSIKNSDHFAEWLRLYNAKMVEIGPDSNVNYIEFKNDYDYKRLLLEYI